MAGSGGVPPQPQGTNSQGLGNGTIGVGATPAAGEAGFTGNPTQFEE